MKIVQKESRSNHPFGERLSDIDSMKINEYGSFKSLWACYFQHQFIIQRAILTVMTVGA